MVQAFTCDSMSETAEGPCGTTMVALPDAANSLRTSRYWVTIIMWITWGGGWKLGLETLGSGHDAASTSSAINQIELRANREPSKHTPKFGTWEEINLLGSQSHRNSSRQTPKPQSWEETNLLGLEPARLLHALDRTAETLGDSLAHLGCPHAAKVLCLCISFGRTHLQ